MIKKDNKISTEKNFKVNSDNLKKVVEQITGKSSTDANNTDSNSTQDTSTTGDSTTNSTSSTGE